MACPWAQAQVRGSECRVLTGHLKAVVQDREQAGVGLRVLQLLVDQFEYLRGALSDYVDLERGWRAL